jgi:hypothetical protein
MAENTDKPADPPETEAQRNRRLRLTETSGKGLRFVGGEGAVIDPFAKPAGRQGSGGKPNA